jgi:hypothetical protein
MIASPLAPCIAAPVIGPALSALKRCAAALAATSTMIACMAMAAPAQAASVTRVEIGSPDTTAFLLSGQLTGGELLALQSEVAKLPPKRRIAVILDSPGGLLAEGLKLGQFFYDAKIATFVFAGAYGCHSACALAFLGGRDAATGKPLRVMMSGARLGFHQFGAKFDTTKTYTKKDMAAVVEDAHRAMDAIIGYLYAINEDLNFLPLMLRAPHEAITLINADEALMKGIHVMEQKTQRMIDPSNIVKRRVASQS